MAAWEITTANSPLEFDTVVNLTNACYQIDDNHFINFWGGSGSDGFAQVFTVNTSTWAVTTANASLEFDTVIGRYHACYKIDTNHFINFYGGNGDDGFAQVFTVNTSTWAVTTANARLEFDTIKGIENACYQIDANHFINFWSDTDGDGKVQVFTVNTSTWAVTTANSALEFDTTNAILQSCRQVDANHFINFWGGEGNDGYVQVFTVNTTTWAVTTANAPLEFDTSVGTYNSCYQIDDNHFINFWLGGASFHGFAQVFTVNTSTWEITTAAASLEFDTVGNSFNSAFQIDSTHFGNSWAGADSDGFAQVFTVNTSTWEITTAAARLEFDTVNGTNNSSFIIDTNHFINFWQGASFHGFVQVFTVELPVPSAIQSVGGLAKASVASIGGLAIASVESVGGLQ